MKKYLIKLAAITLLATALAFSFNIPALSTANADNDNGPTNTVDEFAQIMEIFSVLRENENACIPVDEEVGVVTFVEEPLRLPPGGKDTIGDVTEKTCYRHYFRHTIGDETQHYNALTSYKQGCSEELYELAEKDTSFYSCRAIVALISKGGTTLLFYYIGMIYRWGASIVGIIAVLVIVLNGIRISVSGGDPEAINKSKRMILQSLAGIAVLLLSGLILYTINPDFFVR